MEIPAINLKAIVLIHWLLTVWGCMDWLPFSYSMGNFSILAVGVWAIAQRDSIDAVLMFLIGMAFTILTDIVHFGIYYPMYEALHERNKDTFRFSVGMAILSLILKPLSCFFVYQMYRERGGDYNINFAVTPVLEVWCPAQFGSSPPRTHSLNLVVTGFPTVTRNRDAYQSIDQQDQSSSAKPFNQAEDHKPPVRAY